MESGKPSTSAHASDLPLDVHSQLALKSAMAFDLPFCVRSCPDLTAVKSYLPLSDQKKLSSTSDPLSLGFDNSQLHLPGRVPPISGQKQYSRDQILPIM